MASNYNNNPVARTDKYGRPTLLKRLTQITDKKTGEMIDGAFKGYVEIKGSLYQISTSSMSEEKMKDGKHQRWMKVTKMENRKMSRGL